ncbi:hypothetical protein, partial [Brotomerdimonas butyrica]|uniref:hypothetical protein n=1 Tax=Brotomerdimonas butyrica TaxID=2981721 RepID=UPI0021CEA4F0
LLSSACGSLHLAVNTRDGTFTRKTYAMPGTLAKTPVPDGSRVFFLYLKKSISLFSLVQTADFVLLQPIIPHRGTAVSESRTGTVD